MLTEGTASKTPEELEEAIDGLGARISMFTSRQAVGLNAAGLTLIVVTHDAAVADLADRRIHLKDGRVEREESGDDLRELLADGQELREDLERLNRELLKNPDPEWQKREEIRETLERQEELREDLEKAADDLRRQMDDFERENAAGPEHADPAIESIGVVQP